MVYFNRYDLEAMRLVIEGYKWMLPGILYNHVHRTIKKAEEQVKLLTSPEALKAVKSKLTGKS